MSESRLITVGKIVRTHGVRGALKIYPYGTSLAAKAPGEKIIVHRPPGGERMELTLGKLSPVGKVWVAEFAELTSMNEAEQLVGEEIFLPEEKLPPAEEGEYYHYQLIGLTVVTVQGKIVGTLRGIIDTAGNDVYVVDRGGKEALIPAVEEVIREIDLEGGQMVVDPPEGLIDDL